MSRLRAPEHPTVADWPGTLRVLWNLLRGRGWWCPLCGYDRQMLSFSNSSHATLNRCGVCRDGTYLAETTIPAARSMT